MKLRKIFGIALLSTLLLAGCGKKETAQAQQPDVQSSQYGYNYEDYQAQGYGEVVNTAADNTQGVTVTAANPYEFFNALVGVYEYENANYGQQNGFLVIEPDREAGGILVGDYFDSQRQSYRYVGYDFYCDKMDGNRVYMEYPEVINSDDTAVYSYYVFEVTNEGISVYFSYDSFDAAQLMYTAKKAQ